MLEPKRDPKTLAIEAKLKDPVSLNMSGQPLAEAVGFLSNYTGINIILDPKALAEADITTSTPVNLVTTTPISLKSALKLILQAARAELPDRRRGAADHQPAVVAGRRVPGRPTTSAT